MAEAQVVVNVAKAASQDPNDVKRPFLLPSQSSEINESLEEFGRYAKRAAWDRAFKSLQKVLEANPTGLVPDKEGFLFSVRKRLWQALAELPADGKDAYRLFYDAEAKKLFDEGTVGGVSAKVEHEKLGKVFSSYFATSVGDQAADRLGDLYFEQGEMSKAAECWQAVLEYRPESKIPRVRLLVKTAIALARSGQWPEFARIERIVREKHAGEKVTLGGQDVDAAKHLAALAPGAKASPAVATTALPTDLELVADSEPIWQFRFYPKQIADQIAAARQQWEPANPLSSMVPPAAVDDARVYVSLAGHHLAIDLQTGKLMWRSASYFDIAKKIGNQAYWLRPEQYNVLALDGQVYCIARANAQMAQQNAIFRLSCLNGADGKAAWTSESVAELKEWSFCGTPLTAGDRIFVCCFKPGKATELHAMALDRKTGKPAWNTLIGTHQVDPNQMYGQRTAQPSFALHQGKLYVDTHAGALAEISADTGTLNWGFTYEADLPSTEYWYNQTVTLHTSGPPVVAGSVLYVKGMRSPRLYAIDVSGPKLLWQRPVSKNEMLASIDAERILLAGEEVTAISMEDHAMQWSSRVPVATSEVRPVVTQNRVYQFTSRGIFELDKKTGDQSPVFRGADLERCLGGLLFITPHALISVSNNAVTAYPLRSARPAAAQAAPAAGDLRRE